MDMDNAKSLPTTFCNPMGQLKCHVLAVFSIKRGMGVLSKSQSFSGNNNFVMQVSSNFNQTKNKSSHVASVSS